MQVTLLLCSISAFAVAGSQERVLQMVTVSIPFVAFARRLVVHFTGGSTDSATSQAFDPLVLVPIAGIVIVLLHGVPRGGQRAARPRDYWFVVLTIVLVALGVVVSDLGGGGTTPSTIYYSSLTLLALVLLAVVASESVRDAWPRIERLLPTLGAIVGLYGIYQFFKLPSWDRDWMIASGLTTVGHPYPMQVRVFGTLESPGPYACFVGVAILAAFHIAVVSKGARRVLHAALAVGLMFPLLLSGVRAALIGVLICAAILGLATARGLARVLPIGIGAVAIVGINLVTSRFGGSSTLFSQQRWSANSLGTDPSVQARLNLISVARDSITRVIGQPSVTHADNLWVDVLVLYGALAGVGLFVLTVYILIRCLWTMFKVGINSAAVIALFAVIMGVATDILTFSFGLLAALAFGSTLRQARKQPSNVIEDVPTFRTTAQRQSALIRN